MILRLVIKNLRRRPMRTLFTILGVASSLFIYVATESLARGLGETLDGERLASTLVVYRENRFCPQTSALPERYDREIAEIPGVAQVLPVKVHLNNCRASLDMVAFQGAPVDRLLAQRDLRVVAGDLERFRSTPGTAIVGRAFAGRRGLQVGDSFEMGEIAVEVVGLFAAAIEAEENLILTDLEYLQRAAPGSRVGVVTQFEVQLEDPARASAVAQAIDARFASAEAPTDTRSQLAFLEDMTRDLRQILEFGRIFGAVCVLVVLVLVGNTVFLSVSERVRELGVIMTIGFRPLAVLGLVIGEAMLIVLLGSLLGVGAFLAVVLVQTAAIGVEGVQIAFSAHWSVVARGLGAALICGLLAGALPAIRAARRPVVDALRGGA